ncbi:peptide-methionine (S)-S-oxide reductase MsrA [Mesohalobacter halotolerans]|uniref:Peptide methionine sulfoxide reductase MsrA n=1 Tax=Mesohalobacter halotolerans TaxID=1883405 RepID=A0A4U5TR83_9FLAO|nr:peptide-methionine (S)-S-oxide reductase MsrA [Mesohalobacter halotolerans]MBS3738510.1 peptide-methionine (S)-S-oxide reductase MsrA [Psychroflexus sp.]TKS55898.1 peptide-methionine (S)-S-oxide reductase MsrA [Mesohalobacter halotolerans]
MRSLILLLLFAPLAMACNADNKKSKAQPSMAKNTYQDMEKAYFASGCFWCVEAIYEKVKGVKEVVSGYSGGHTKNPTYEESNTGKTGHAEAVKVIYDSDIVSFKTLVDVYFASQNVTQVNGQGPDRGSQYRSIIFYQNDKEKAIIDKKIKSLQPQYNKPIAAEVKAFEKFWIAEEYHQDYKKKHPNNRYIQNVSNPRFERFKAKMPEVLK